MNDDLKVLNSRMGQIWGRLKDEDFLKNKGLGNEIGFYIFDYPAKYELQVREHLVGLFSDLDKFDISHTRINLFESIIELLDARNLTERAFKVQKERGDDALFNALKGPLEQNRVAEFIAKKIDFENNQFILLHGLGNAWPIVRGHGLLNALHAKVGNTPTVLFFPGEYTGAGLKAFGVIESNNYYRAFRFVP